MRMKYVNQKTAMIYRCYVSARSKQHPAVTHVKRNESKNEAQVAPMIAGCDIEPRQHVLVRSRIGTILAVFCSIGVREVAAGKLHEGTHVLVARQTLRWVDGD
jgi:hypothetical protein